MPSALICTIHGCRIRTTGRGPNGDGDERCSIHQSNPWADRLICPQCRTARWTMPVGVIAPGWWRCIACHLSLHPADALEVAS